MKKLLLFTLLFVYMASGVALAESSVKTLESLTVTGETLTPVFSSDVTDYTVNVPYAKDQVTIAAVPNPNANVAPEDLGNKPLIVGENTFTINVTAEDGGTNVYTVKITRAAASTYATLSVLTVSSETLTPVFSSDVTDYTVSVSSTTDNVTITATSNHTNATIGGDTGDQALSVGENTFKVTVTAEDGVNTKEYTIVVTRATPPPSDNATLSNLTVSSGVLSPSLNVNTLAYTVAVPYLTNQILLTPTTTETNATVVGGGVQSLQVGENVFNITVTAPDLLTSKTYVVKVTRAAKVDAALKNITISVGTLSPAFNPSTLNYTVNLPSTTSTITIQAVKNDVDATVTANFTNFVLQEGVNNFAFAVTAQDGRTTKTYTVKVIRGGKTDATLKGITLSTGTLSPVFNAATYSYTVNVPSTTNLITIRPVKNDVDATATADLVNQPLAIGENTFAFTVIAQDGVTKKTYTVKVIRGIKTDATLSNITVSAGALTPAFSSANTSYSVYVPSGTSTISIRATKNDAGAVVTSDLINQVLRDGENTYTFTVTAQDGTTKKVYTVKVIRGVRTDASLKSLTLSIGTLSPKFSPSIYSYTANVTNNITSMQVIGIQNNALAKITGSGTQQLKVGKNVFSITVLAEDGVTKRTYTIEITRAGSTVGTEDISTSEVKVYPTLTTGNVYIETPDNSLPLVRVYSTTGKLLQSVRATEIDLANYSKGIYIIHIDNKVVKVVKE